MTPQDWTWPSKPTTADEFERMMLSLDAHFGHCNIPVPHRDFQAITMVSRAFGISGNVMPARHSPRPPFCPEDIYLRIGDWFELVYGDRTKVDPSPGSIVFEMAGIHWRLRLPRYYGTLEFFVDRNLAHHGIALGLHGPATHNLLSSIDSLTPAYAARLSDQDCKIIQDTFLLGADAIYWLDKATGNDLLHQARQDYKSSVNALLERQGANQARWDTAQCAEKVFKGLLARTGHAYPRDKVGHNIPVIGKLVTEKLGVVLTTTALATIDCKPAVRYGEVAVSASDALHAHHALLKVISELSQVISPQQQSATTGTRLKP
ncbi:hypothetical protein ABID97_003045 [Variovorax sp. OAS795]|uniref:hypothetical protein n=1 Tax=Variovorax sp. OAS795 TaxID=3034231 RepID=UPI003399D77A